MGCSICSKESRDADTSPIARRRPASLMENETLWLRDTLESGDAETDTRRSTQADFLKVLTESEIEHVNGRLSDHMVDNLTEQIKDLETYRTLYFKEMQELQRLRGTVHSLQSTLEESINSIGKLEQDLEVQRKKEEALRSENEGIKREIEGKKADSVELQSREQLLSQVMTQLHKEKLIRVTKLHAFHLLSTTQTRLISDALHTWHIRMLETEALETGLISPSLHFSSCSELDYSLMEKDDLTRTNPLVETIRKQGNGWHTSMPKTRLLRLFEDTLNAKYESDAQDRAAGREVGLLSEFMTDFLIRKFGLTKLAIHELSQFVPGLFKLYQEGHAYGVVMARMLGLFHPDPIPKEIAAYLTKAKVEFSGLCDKMRKERQGTSKMLTLTPKSGSRSAEFVENGGFLHLSDVLTAVYKAFAGFPDLGAFAISLLKPDSLTPEEYVSFQLCHKVSTTGKRPEELFRVLDSRSLGSLTSKQVIQGLYEVMELWISAEDLYELIKSSQLTSKEFVKMINYERYFGYALSNDLQVSGQTYIRVLVDVYDHMKTVQADLICSVFSEVALGEEMTRLELGKAITRLDPQFPQVQFRSLSTEGPVDLNKFQKVVFDAHIGNLGLGPFLISPGEVALTRIPFAEKNTIMTPDSKGKRGKEFEFDHVSKPKTTGRQGKKTTRRFY